MAESKIEVGKRAPAFSLPNQDDEKVALKDLKGQWVVVYFYPRDDTPGCTVEALEFTKSLKAFEKLDAAVFGISPDSPEKHRKFRAKHKLKVNLLSDEKKSMMEKYGAFGEKMMYGKKVQGVIRSTVLIDPSGKIAHHWPTVKAKGHAEKVKEQLQVLRG